MMGGGRLVRRAARPRVRRAAQILPVLTVLLLAGTPVAAGAGGRLDAALGDAADALRAGNPAKAVTILRPLAEAGLGHRSVRLRFLLGLALLQSGETAAAVGPLQSVPPRYLLADYALLNLAAAHRRLGNPAQAAAALRRLVEDYPGSLLLERALREMVRDLREAGDRGGLRWALEAAARLPGGGVRPAAMLALAELHLEEGRAGAAEPLVHDLWLEYPARAEADRAWALLGRLPKARPFDAEELFARATRLYQAGQYRRAIDALGFLAAAGDHATTARLDLGIAWFQVRGYRQALATLGPMVQASPAERPEALYWLARSYGRLGDQGTFTRLLEELVADAPQSHRAEDALLFLGRAYEEAGDPERALAAYERLGRDYPTSPLVDRALWASGWLLYRRGEPRRALEAFRELRRQPASLLGPQAGYWEGRMLEELGRRREALQAYRDVADNDRDDYYTTQARRRLAGLGESPPPPVIRPAVTAPPPRPGHDLHLDKARELAMLSLDGEAGDEYWQAARNHPEEVSLVGEAGRAFVRLSQFDRAVWLARRYLRPRYLGAGRRAPVQDFWELLYPRGFWDIIQVHAARQAVDPYLVLALIREESAFAAQAVSRAGAVGLMQLLPETARTQVTADEAEGRLVDVETNIALGTRYLAGLLRDFGNDLALALAAYNAGPQQVRRWLDGPGAPATDAFIEAIPFPETRQYVKRVLGSYARYRTLYAATGP